MTNVHLADQFGALKAQLADLDKAAKEIRAQLIALGAGAYDGDLFRATVSVAPRKSVDWESIALTLRPSFAYPQDKWSPGMLEMYQAATTVADVTTVNVKARVIKAA